MGRISGYIRGFGLCIFLVLGGCKIHVAVPAGGSVETTSGSLSCASGRTCEVNVADTDFDEHFIAVPDQGYYFKGWKKRDRGFCGGGKGECYLSTTGFPGQPALLGFLSSDDEVFYLEPEFVEAPDDWTPIDVALSAVVDDDLRECLRWASGSFSYAEQLETLICANNTYFVNEDPDIEALERWTVKSFQGIDQFGNLQLLQVQLKCEAWLLGPEPVACGVKFTGLGDLSELRQLALGGDENHAFNHEKDPIDVSFLRELAELESLELPFVRMASVSPIGALTNLRNLGLGRSYVRDLTPLRSLVKLQSLDLSWNSVEDVSLFQDMHALEELRLRGALALSGSADFGVQQIAALESLANLRVLDLSLGGIQDISPLSRFSELEILILYSNHIEDISTVSSMRQLRELRLSNNPLTDLQPLENLTQLQTISLNLLTTQRDQVRYLEGLRQLKNLYLRFIPPEEGTDGVETFVDYGFLSGARHLERLHISRGGLTDISFVRDLVNLWDVSLEFNHITDISPVREIKSLKSLDLSINDIENISPLRGLDNVWYLDLSGNSISTLGGVLSDMSGLVAVNLLGNPLECQEVEREFPGIWERGYREWSVIFSSYVPSRYYLYSSDDARYLEIALDEYLCP